MREGWAIAKQLTARYHPSVLTLPFSNSLCAKLRIADWFLSERESLEDSAFIAGVQAHVQGIMVWWRFNRIHLNLIITGK